MIFHRITIWWITLNNCMSVFNWVDIGRRRWNFRVHCWITIFHRFKDFMWTIVNFCYSNESNSDFNKERNAVIFVRMFADTRGAQDTTDNLSWTQTKRKSLCQLEINKFIWYCLVTRLTTLGRTKYSDWRENSDVL